MNTCSLEQHSKRDSKIFRNMRITVSTWTPGKPMTSPEHTHIFFSVHFSSSLLIISYDPKHLVSSSYLIIKFSLLFPYHLYQ